ncbi:MAG: TetR/AcrR family transcriptional regulator [Calditrichia bacterium]
MDKIDEKLEIRKEQILASAMRCFARFGYHKTTLDDIATAIGMSKPSLYYYYKNKETIFREAIEAEATRIRGHLAEKFASETTASGKLSCMLKTKLQLFRERVDMLDLSVQVIIETKPVVEKFFREFRQREVDLLTSILREGMESGEFRQNDPQRVADSIRAIMDALRFRELQSANAKSASDIDYAKLENETEFMLDLLLNGLRK